MLYSKAPNTVSKALEETVASPHNIVVSHDGKKMFVPRFDNVATGVTVYDLNPGSGGMVKRAVISTAANPLGLTYYRR